jgi:hypothetical protein
MDVREIKQRLAIGQVLQHNGRQPDKYNRLQAVLANGTNKSVLLH